MKIVIIGNSAAGLNALETFRKFDQISHITIVTKEKAPAYSRVLLPYYLRKKIRYDQMFIRDRAYYKKMNVSVIEDRVTQVDFDNQRVVLKKGQPLSYDQLLIATGSLPVKPIIPGLEGPRIHNLWTLEDVKNIEACFEEGKRVLMLGAAFVSLQAAWAAVKREQTTSIFVRSHIMRNVLDEAGVNRLKNNMLDQGVTFITETNLKKINRNPDGSIRIEFSNRDALEVDTIIVGAGIKANIDFLEDSNLAIGTGILVNNQMETNLPGIYAAGDVAAGLSAFGERHVVRGLWPTAVEQGKIAGANMAGNKVIYEGSLNMNVTSLFGLTVASMGKFLKNEGEKEIVFINDKENYLKLVVEKSILIGGTAVGMPMLVNSLGLMKPYIQQRKQVDRLTLDNLVKYQFPPVMMNAHMAS